MGSIIDRKTAKNRSKPKTACKIIKIDNFLHPSYQNSDKWSIQRFDGYSRLVEVHNCRSDQREIGTQIRKVENQIQRPIRVF